MSRWRPWRARHPRAPRGTLRPEQGIAHPRLLATPARGSSGPPQPPRTRSRRPPRHHPAPSSARRARRASSRPGAYTQPPWSVTVRPQDDSPRRRSGFSGAAGLAHTTHQKPRRAKHWVFEQIGKEGTRIIQPSGEEKYLHKNDAITLHDKSELYLASSFLPLIFRTNTGDGTILTPYYREDEVEVLKLGG